MSANSADRKWSAAALLVAVTVDVRRAGARGGARSVGVDSAAAGNRDAAARGIQPAARSLVGDDRGTRGSAGAGGDFAGGDRSARQQRRGARDHRTGRRSVPVGADRRAADFGRDADRRAAYLVDTDGHASAGSATPRGGAQGDDGGRTLPLVYAGGRYKAILPGSASFTLALTWGTTTLTEPGRAGLMLPAVHAGSVRAAIDLPGEIADVRMQQGAITARSITAGRTRIEMTLDPGKATLISWSSRETNDQAVRREVRLLSDAKTIVTIGEADERLATLFDVTVVQGDPTRFDVHVPAGFELTSVSGPSD